VAILGAVLALLSICQVVPQNVALAIQLAAAAAGVLVLAGTLLWGVICRQKPCNWALLLGSQIALGTSLAILAFTGPLCCPQYQPFAWASFFAAIGGFVTWAALCKVSVCDLSAELAASLAIVAPLVNWLNLLLPAGCYNQQATFAVSVAQSISVIWALACKKIIPKQV
jgi:hypothetical protein